MPLPATLLALLLYAASSAAAQEGTVEAPVETPVEVLMDSRWSWRQDPARWVLLPAEERLWQGLETSQEAERFLEELWQRREQSILGTSQGPSPRDVFHERVEEADLLYGRSGYRGSLTARGRAYILIGAPSQISQAYRPAPQLNPMRTGGTSRQTTRILVETWTWRPEDLSPALRAVMEKRRWRTELEVEFIVERGRYLLFNGESFLRSAVKAFAGGGAD